MLSEHMRAQLIRPLPIRSGVLLTGQERAGHQDISEVIRHAEPLLPAGLGASNSVGNEGGDVSIPFPDAAEGVVAVIDGTGYARGGSFRLLGAGAWILRRSSVTNREKLGRVVVCGDILACGCLQFFMLVALDHRSGPTRLIVESNGPRSIVLRRGLCPLDTPAIAGVRRRGPFPLVHGRDRRRSQWGQVLGWRIRSLAIEGANGELRVVV